MCVGKEVQQCVFVLNPVERRPLGKPRCRWGLILTLNLLTTTLVALSSNASKWQMGFNSAFKGLKLIFNCVVISK